MASSAGGTRDGHGGAGLRCRTDCDEYVTEAWLYSERAGGECHVIIGPPERVAARMSGDGWWWADREGKRLAMEVRRRAP